ncbi:MAG: hypothetical protein DRI94_05545 [Bacteroidetes bacterium]|nr:MAG: hypothetical protein DRI94_05545 [Bacteroidota bacterium]
MLKIKIIMDKELRYFTLPNIFTLLNLVAGSVAILFAFEKSGNLTYAATFIFIAAFFDFTDGFVARLTNSVSKSGKYLDSLSDIVSFGIAPAVIVYQMLKTAMEIKVFSVDLPYAQVLILLSPIVLIIAAALRLAKFDADRRQTHHFLGLPVPISALFFASLPLVNTFDPDNLLILKTWLDVNMPFDFILAVIGVQVYVLTNFWVYVVSIFVFAILQLLEIPMFSFKSDNYSFKVNAAKYSFLILAILMFAFFQCFIIPIIIILYILFSVGIDIGNVFTKK